jgi:hypothetical protein
MGAEPTPYITLKSCLLVPTPTPNKLAKFHFFRAFNPDLQPEAHAPSLRLGYGCETRLTVASCDEHRTCQRNWDFHNSAADMRRIPKWYGINPNLLANADRACQTAHEHYNFRESVLGKKIPPKESPPKSGAQK